MKRLALLALVVSSACGPLEAEAAGGFRSFRRGARPADRASSARVALPLYSANSPTMQGTVSNPVPNGAVAWCGTAQVNVAVDWCGASGTDRNWGIFQLGTTFGAPNSLSVYSYANNYSDEVDAALYDADGGTDHHITSINNSALYKATHRVSYCYSNGYGSLWIDGVQKKAPTLQSTFTFTQPASMRVGDNGSGFRAWGGNAHTSICFSGPVAGVGSSTDPRVTVDAACGEFTPYDDGTVCKGCVVPLANATKVVNLGDSITLSEFFPRSMSQKLNALIGTGYSTTNAGVSGNTVAQIKARYESTYRGADWAVVTVMGGTNNVGLGDSAASTWATLSALFDEILADGKTLHACTVLPWKNSFHGWTQAKQDETDSLNASILAYCTAHGLTCADTYAGMGDGVDPTKLATAYDDGDHLHLSQAGGDRYATLLSAAFP